MTPHENPSTSTSGRMTAAMRAAPARSSPAALRIALVRDGVVIEERTLLHAEEVTVGPTERSTFVVPERTLPERLVVFEHAGGRYHLRCAPGMSGRVATARREIDLGAEGERRIPLEEGARGRVILGDTTLLFQIAPAPPAPPKAPLPHGLRARLSDGIDWVTTLIAAFSFLIHFGAVGSIWSDWMDPVLDDDVHVAQLVETLRALPTPPPLEIAPGPQAPKAEAQAAQAPEKARAGASTRGAAGGGRAAGAGPARMGDAAASALAAELRQLDLSMIHALGEGRGATGAVVDGSNVPLHLLEQSAASEAGAGRGQIAGLSFGSSQGGVVRPGAVRGGEPLGNLDRGAPATAGSTTAVARPKGNATVSPPLVTGGGVPNAGPVIAGLKGPFKSCYQRGLDDDPTMQGSVRVTAKIGPNGEVLSATPSAIAGLSSKVVSCVVGRVQGARFDPPEGGFAILVVPISFVRQ